MESQRLNKLKDEVKVGFAITIAEKVFSNIKKDDTRYMDGREALNKCWVWAENNGVLGDDLYELVDNAECTGIFEHLANEDDLKIARIWSLLVDLVCYTSWNAYKKENVKYLPQALEGIKENSINIFIESAIETAFITTDEITLMKQQLLSNYEISDGKIVIIREDIR